MAAARKAQAVKGAGRRCHAAGPLQRGNQGVDFATGLKATQGADGALAGFAFSVTEGLHQLRVAAITGLGDLDDYGAECSLSCGK